MIPPEMLHTVAAIHDEQTKTTFFCLLGCKTLSNGPVAASSVAYQIGRFWYDFALIHISICLCIILGSFSVTVVTALPDTSLVVDCLISNKEDNTISCSLHQAIHPNYHLSGLTTEIKLQRKLTDSLLRSEASEGIDSATCPKEVLRLRSIQGSGAGAWLDAIPNSQRFPLKPKEF